MDDPEAIFQEGWLLCDVGEFERGLEHCTAPSTSGYYVAPVLEGRPQFDAIRTSRHSRPFSRRREKAATQRTRGVP